MIVNMTSKELIEQMIELGVIDLEMNGPLTSEQKEKQIKLISYLLENQMKVLSQNEFKAGDSVINVELSNLEPPTTDYTKAIKKFLKVE